MNKPDRSQLPGVAKKKLQELELELLLNALVRHYGYDFRGYSGPSLRRRIDRAMQQEHVKTISGLQEVLLHRPDAMHRFIDAMSVSVTSMFRDPAVYRYIRTHVVPTLRTYPMVRIWHAGCATGEEAYSMAILLHEAGLLEKSRIYATDLSAEVLRKARTGILPLPDMEKQRDAYAASGGTADLMDYVTTDDENVRMGELLRNRIVFSQHNLVSDQSFNEFQLIFCRNVLIYFGDELRDRVLELATDSLCRRGVLVLGTKEVLRFSSVANRYEVMDENLRIYQKKP